MTNCRPTGCAICAFPTLATEAMRPRVAYQLRGTSTDPNDVVQKQLTHHLDKVCATRGQHCVLNLTGQPDLLLLQYYFKRQCWNRGLDEWRRLTRESARLERHAEQRASNGGGPDDRPIDA